MRKRFVRLLRVSHKVNSLVSSLTAATNSFFFKVSMKIAPGEPVPPGFENEVKQQAEIQPALDRIKDEALVGLEYITELVMGEGKEASYHCVLCDKRGDPRTILHHITSYNHRLKYLVRHL